MEIVFATRVACTIPQNHAFPLGANAHFPLIRVQWHLATLPMRTAITFDYMALATQHAV